MGSFDVFGNVILCTPAGVADRVLARLVGVLGRSGDDVGDVDQSCVGLTRGDLAEYVGHGCFLAHRRESQPGGFLDMAKKGQLKAFPEALAASVAADNVSGWPQLATVDGKVYGVGFTPDVSVLAWNKDLFAKAGLDPEKGPTTIDEKNTNHVAMVDAGPLLYSRTIKTHICRPSMRWISGPLV